MRPSASRLAPRFPVLGSPAPGPPPPRAALVAAALAGALAAACAADPPEPRLLLLITVDTLRADRLGAYGSDHGLTPHLDALAGESEVFMAAYAPAAHTLPSIAALQTGRYPEAIGVRHNESVLPDTVPTLAAELSARGWRTGAVVSNWILRRDAGLARGFDVYDDTMEEVEATRPLAERRARATTDAGLRVLDSCAKGEDWRCFLWVHYQDPHGPYTPPAGLRERNLPRERSAPDGRRELPVNDDFVGVGGIPDYQFLDGQHEVAFYRAGYDGEVSYMDTEVGRLLGEVSKRGLLSQTLLVFTADHGEGLGENDYWFAHGEHLSDPLVRVPLMIRRPGAAPRQRTDVVSLVDLFPTLLAVLAGEPRGPALPGRTLLGEGAEEAASSAYLATLGGADVARFGLVEGDYKYVVSLRGGVWYGELYRRGREDVNLAGPAPHIAAAMRGRLDRLRAGLPRGPETPRRALTPADRARLHSLGYVEAPSVPGFDDSP